MLAGYRVEDIIGFGGMGIVYRAEQVALRRHVALKVLAPRLSRDEAYRERFKREGAHAAALHHSHVVPVYDSGESGGMLYLAMMLVEGHSLAEELVGGSLALDHAVAVLGPIAAALDAAHTIGIVHRDVKPQNVLLDSSGWPMLADFGVAKATTAATLTATRDFVGSVNYAAPEQIRGEPVTPAADVYSLGGVLFTCLTGTPPFERESEAAVLQAQLNDAPPELEAGVEFASALNAIIAAGMAKRPQDRPPSASALIDKATRLLAGGARPGRALTGRGERSPTKLPRSQTATAVASGVVTASARADPIAPAQLRTNRPPIAEPTQADRKRPEGPPPDPANARDDHRRRWALGVAAVAVAAAIAVTVVVTEKRSSSDAAAGHTARKGSPATAHPVILHVSSPVDGSTVRTPVVTVHGTVTPSHASVEVQGQIVRTADGVFFRTLRMSPGANKIEVVASSPGQRSATAEVAVRGDFAASSAQAKRKPSSVHPPQLETVSSPDGTYTILVPAGWQYYAESSPEGTTTDVWLGADQSQKLQLFTSDCVSCVEGEGSPHASSVQLPAGTISSFEINPSAVGFAAQTEGDPNPDNGLIVVTRDGATVTGYAQVDLWLPSSMHATATRILDSFSLLKAASDG